MPKIDDLVIDPEFRDLLPSLPDEKIDALKELVVRDGKFTHTITAWKHDGKEIVLDGHHRFDIWNNGDLPKKIKPPGVTYISLPDRAHAKIWIRLHADRQRNMTPEQESFNRGEAHNEIKGIPGGWLAPKKTGGAKKSAKNKGQTGKNMKGQSDPSSSGEPNGRSANAAQTVSESTGVSERTVKRDAAYATALDRIGAVNAKFKDDILNGTTKVPKADVCKIGKLESNADIGRAIGNIRNGRPWDFSEVEEEEPEEDPSIEEIMNEKNKEIESFCRKLAKLFKDECPDDEWLDDLGRKDGAETKVKQACQTLRTAKCTKICPICSGEGCSKCHNTGRVTTMAYDQLVT